MLGAFEQHRFGHRYLPLDLPLGGRRESPAFLGHVADQNASEPVPPLTRGASAKLLHASLRLQKGFLHQVGSRCLGLQRWLKTVIGDEQQVIAD